MPYLFVTSLKVTLFCLNYKYLNFMRVEFTTALNENKRLEISNTNQISSFSIAYPIQDNQLYFFRPDFSSEPFIHVLTICLFT